MNSKTIKIKVTTTSLPNTFYISLLEEQLKQLTVYLDLARDKKNKAAEDIVRLTSDLIGLRTDLANESIKHDKILESMDTIRSGIRFSPKKVWDELYEYRPMSSKETYGGKK
jgi:hypothetical protein